MKTSNDFEKIAKKSKRKNRFVIIGMSIVGAMIVAGVTTKGLVELTAKNGQAVQDYYSRLHTIAYPNVDYNTAIFEPTSLFSGYYHMGRVKDIDGITVPYEDIDAPYSLTQRRSYLLQKTLVTSYPGETAAYTYGSSYKSPIFYNRDYDYSNKMDAHMEKTQDISLLSKMSGDAVEVAVTFDKGYTIKEIEEKIPDNLKVNWYWIGTTYSDYDTALLSPENQIGLRLNPYLVRDGQTVDKKAQEQVWEESYRTFLDNLQIALDKDWLGLSSSTSEGEVFNLHTDVESFLKNNPSVTNAKFAGIILTGRAENFKQLENADWIYASNIGQSVEIQPYHHLEK